MPLKFDPKPSGAAFSAVSFSNFDKCRPEGADDVISSVAVDKVGIDIRVKFGDSTLNSPNKHFNGVLRSAHDWAMRILWNTLLAIFILSVAAFSVSPANCECKMRPTSYSMPNVEFYDCKAV